MAKKQNDKLPEDGESKPKKKGLFGFLRRKSKSKNEHIEMADEVSDPKKPAVKNKTATSPDKAPPKKRGRPKKQLAEADVVANEAVEEETPKKKKRSLFGFLKHKKKSTKEDAKPAAEAGGKDTTSEKAKKKPVKGKVTDAGKAPAKKRGRPKKNVEDIQIAASETADEPEKKKGLFGFLKRNKKTDSAEEQVVGVKKALDISIPPVAGEVLQMELNPAIEEEAAQKKPGFFTKKVIFIIIALCGVSGATGAAAIVFAGPLLGADPLKGLACRVAHKADFVLMKEKRVTAFIRADLLPPRQRIEMLMSYTKFLEAEYAEADLITVSMLDTQGPMSRVNFRGDNIGAQVVYAPDPLMSMATNAMWEVRYVNVTETYGGRFMGDRFTLSDNEIDEFNNDLLLALDCYMEKTEEELAAEELAAEEAAAEAEKVTEAAAEVEEAPADGDEVDEHAETAEPGFIDNMLGMVGLGGGEHEDEGEDEMGEHASDMADGDGYQQAFPGDGGPNSDVMHEEPGLFDGVLSIVGLGGDDEMQKDTIPGVLGTRVKYN